MYKLLNLHPNTARRLWTPFPAFVSESYETLFHIDLSVANQTSPSRRRLWILLSEYLAFQNNLMTFPRPSFRILKSVIKYQI